MSEIRGGKKKNSGERRATKGRSMWSSRRPLLYQPSSSRRVRDGSSSSHASLPVHAKSWANVNLRDRVGGGIVFFFAGKKYTENYTDAACVDWQDESRYSGKGIKGRGGVRKTKNALVWLMRVQIKIRPQVENRERFGRLVGPAAWKLLERCESNGGSRGLWRQEFFFFLRIFLALFLLFANPPSFQAAASREVNPSLSFFSPAPATCMTRGTIRRKESSVLFFFFR